MQVNKLQVNSASKGRPSGDILQNVDKHNVNATSSYPRLPTAHVQIKIDRLLYKPYAINI